MDLCRSRHRHRHWPSKCAASIAGRPRSSSLAGIWSLIEPWPRHRRIALTVVRDLKGPNAKGWRGFFCMRILGKFRPLSPGCGALSAACNVLLSSHPCREGGLVTTRGYKEERKGVPPFWKSWGAPSRPQAGGRGATSARAALLFSCPCPLPYASSAAGLALGSPQF